MIKRILKSLLIFFALVLITKPVLAAGSPVLHFFWASGCPHCAKEKLFLETLKEEYPQLVIKDYEVTSDRKNLFLLQEFGKKLEADVSGVPFTVIGQKHFTGFLSAETTGEEITEAVREEIVRNGAKPTPKPFQTKQTLKIPFLGELSLKTLSLPTLTVILALVDGFNPCAMWTLLFLISLLLGMKDRKRMWILGTAFIVASALVYFLFLAAWLNLFIFLGFIVWIRVVIGLVALAAGGYNLHDYWVNRGGCKVMGNQKRQRVFAKIREITQNRQLLLALGGIMLLAVAVNLVELICSAGLPAIYTQILSLANLPRWQYYLYLLFYIFIFMLDDLFVFFTAMLTLQATGIQNKYARFSHLIGGLIMLVIGLLLLFRPEWLMFG